MTREESIKRTEEAIRGLKSATEDLENCLDHFIDFDNDMEGLGPIDNLENGAEALGMMKCGNDEKPDKRREVLFYGKYNLYTKCFVPGAVPMTSDHYPAPKF